MIVESWTAVHREDVGVDCEICLNRESNVSYHGGVTDRQTDILLTEIKVITDLFVIVIREIYVHVYTIMLVC